VASVDSVAIAETAVLIGSNLDPNGGDSDPDGDTVMIQSVQVDDAAVPLGLENTLPYGARLLVHASGDFTDDPTGAKNRRVASARSKRRPIPRPTGRLPNHAG